MSKQDHAIIKLIKTKTFDLQPACKPKQVLNAKNVAGVVYWPLLFLCFDFAATK
jgi:hypothetical protein